MCIRPSIYSKSIKRKVPHIQINENEKPETFFLSLFSSDLWAYALNQINKFSKKKIYSASYARRTNKVLRNADNYENTHFRRLVIMENIKTTYFLLSRCGKRNELQKIYYNLRILHADIEERKQR